MPEHPTIAAARIALRDAEIAIEIEKNAKERGEYGICPGAYRHLDARSFVAGLCLGFPIGFGFVCIFACILAHS